MGGKLCEKSGLQIGHLANKNSVLFAKLLWHFPLEFDTRIGLTLLGEIPSSVTKLKNVQKIVSHCLLILHFNKFISSL